MNTTNFPSAESAAKALCALYGNYGYKHFRMSKFEEYDFYARNKNFLVSSNIITFTDLDGKLMALKPDVTLSIVKNAEYGHGAAQKVYYNEKVYRAEEGSREFREITQTGLECVGDIGFYDIAEVIMLAVKSLDLLSGAWILDISHMGFVAGLLAHTGAAEKVKRELLTAISEKNVPYITAICAENGFSDADTEKLAALARLYSPFGEGMETLKSLSVNAETDAAVAELERLYRVLSAAGLAANVYIDFSIVNDMNYYNGFIFRGYIEGIPQGVLAGGSYDNLLAKMKKKGSAIGFALYLDQLETLLVSDRRYDVDVLITYDAATATQIIVAAVNDCLADGKKVRVQKANDGSVSAKTVIDLSGKDGGGNA
ncbi:MAG: ATP phosphoribosyltransferase regulatory subunit [Clostridia bacterium]|nr:ATP phosphoribosyltransferase regulatory subunit [Clostridia bacterium]